LLGNAWKAGESDEAVQVRRAQHQVAQHRQRNHRNLRVRQRHTQRAKSWGSTDEITNARSAKQYYFTERLLQTR
jgi:ribosomal protein L44E